MMGCRWRLGLPGEALGLLLVGGPTAAPSPCLWYVGCASDDRSVGYRSVGMLGCDETDDNRNHTTWLTCSATRQRQPAASCGKRRLRDMTAHEAAEGRKRADEDTAGCCGPRRLWLCSCFCFWLCHTMNDRSKQQLLTTTATCAFAMLRHTRAPASLEGGGRPRCVGSQQQLQTIQIQTALRERRV